MLQHFNTQCSGAILQHCCNILLHQCCNILTLTAPEQCCNIVPAESSGLIFLVLITSSPFSGKFLSYIQTKLVTDQYLFQQDHFGGLFMRGRNIYVCTMYMYWFPGTGSGLQVKLWSILILIHILWKQNDEIINVVQMPPRDYMFLSLSWTSYLEVSMLYVLVCFLTFFI